MCILGKFRAYTSMLWSPENLFRIPLPSLLFRADLPHGNRYALFMSLRTLFFFIYCQKHLRFLVSSCPSRAFCKIPGSSDPTPVSCRPFSQLIQTLYLIIYFFAEFSNCFLIIFIFFVTIQLHTIPLESGLQLLFFSYRAAVTLKRNHFFL